MSDLPIFQTENDRVACPHPPKKAVKSVCLAVMIAAVLLAAYLSATAFSIVSYSRVDKARPADAVIVLGAGTTDGKVSPVYRERINHAVDLFQSENVHTVILTGGTGEGNTVSDAYAAGQYAISQGVPESKILLEEQSTITEENLKYAKAIMDEHGFDTAVIVSDPLHMKRAMLMAEDYEIIAFSSPTPTSMYRSVRTKLPFLLREEFFYIGYRIVRIFK